MSGRRRPLPVGLYVLDAELRSRGAADRTGRHRFAGHAWSLRSAVESLCRMPLFT